MSAVERADGGAPRAVDYLIDHASLVTMAAPDVSGGAPLAGASQGAIGLVADGALAVADGHIVALGPRDEVCAAVEAADGWDAEGRVVTPGLVDAHTHPVWAGSRAAELEQRLEGASYLEILERGGGINSTVRATRAADEATLLEAVLDRLDLLMAHGATTVEAKTGYGLSVETELAHLTLLAEADRRHPVRVVPTFLGAHAVPPEYRGRAADYVDLVVDEMLPAVAEHHPAAFCDVFCDEGAFTPQQTARILRRASVLGLPLKVHSDELAHLGCTARAAALGAASADHLVKTTEEEMRALAASGTVAVLLPGTTIGLGSTEFADGRAMVANGVPVALGTDFNPGTCPCPNLPLVMAVAARYLRLTPAEVLVAATRNAAAACKRADRAGQLALGRPADLAVMATDDYRALAYAFGANPVAGVMIGGEWTRPPGGMPDGRRV